MHINATRSKSCNLFFFPNNTKNVDQAKKGAVGLGGGGGRMPRKRILAHVLGGQYLSLCPLLLFILMNRQKLICYTYRIKHTTLNPTPGKMS